MTVVLGKIGRSESIPVHQSKSIVMQAVANKNGFDVVSANEG